jgi:hypothetical protein
VLMLDTEKSMVVAGGLYSGGGWGGGIRGSIWALLYRKAVMTFCGRGSWFAEVIKNVCRLVPLTASSINHHNHHRLFMD